jgi:hypothetical protein
VGETNIDSGAEFDAKGAAKAAEKVRDRVEKRSEGVQCQMETNGNDAICLVNDQY